MPYEREKDLNKKKCQFCQNTTITNQVLKSLVILGIQEYKFIAT
jgi:hypothetical protein